MSIASVEGAKKNKLSIANRPNTIVAITKKIKPTTTKCSRKYFSSIR